MIFSLLIDGASPIGYGHAVAGRAWMDVHTDEPVGTETSGPRQRILPNVFQSEVNGSIREGTSIRTLWLRGYMPRYRGSWAEISVL